MCLWNHFPTHWNSCLVQIPRKRELTFLDMRTSRCILQPNAAVPLQPWPLADTTALYNWSRNAFFLLYASLTEFAEPLARRKKEKEKKNNNEGSVALIKDPFSTRFRVSRLVLASQHARATSSVFPFAWVIPNSVHILRLLGVLPGDMPFHHRAASLQPGCHKHGLVIPSTWFPKAPSWWATLAHTKPKLCCSKSKQTHNSCGSCKTGS